MSFGIAGSNPLSDLTKPVEELLRDLLFSHWSINDPARGSAAEQAADNQVRFGLGWGTGIKNNFEIHCLHAITMSTPVSNGWRYHGYVAVIDFHVFARRSAQKEPVQLRKIIHEIERIVVQNRLNLGEQVRPIKLRQWISADDPDDFGNAKYFHRVGKVEARYWKVHASV